MVIPEYLVKNIFLIDDDLDDCSLFEQAIKEISPDFNFSCVNSCSDIFSQIEQHTPDLIFLDINMPLKTGIDCLIEIQEHTLFKSIPIIMYSGSGYRKDINACYSFGAKLYFQKPPLFDDLVKSLKHILKMTWHMPNDIPSKFYDNGNYYPFEVKDL